MTIIKKQNILYNKTEPFVSNNLNFPKINISEFNAKILTVRRVKICMINFWHRNIM